MFAVKSNPLLLRSPAVFSETRHRRIISQSSGRRNVQVHAVISGGDSKTATSPLDSKENNGLVVQRGSGSSGGSNNGEVLEVKAVVTIRKKMKSNIVEDQLEYFINGAGQGIQIQLVSEQIDP
ncbi:lipoxygenase 6 choloroplastic-like, partial [Trifolium medium]|nr:lipoxygenase 6 choloroplastic-like [Trifolium medium]